MSRMNDTPDGPCGSEPAPPQGSPGRPPAPPPPGNGAAPRILLIDADRALSGLLDEWLAAEGCVVAHEVPADGTGRFDLVIVDVPFPRCGGVDLIERITNRHAATPILALSTAFFAGTACCGAVAHALGAACVLPMPASRDALISAVRRFVPR
jgi:DNA-binding response OmpR family regulator